MRSIISLAAALLFVFCLSLKSARAQQPSLPAPPNQSAPTQASLEQIWTQFMARADEYEATFKNLSAEETKVVEEYTPSGELTKQHRLLSDLVVYQSPRDTRKTAEYRDTRVVDGKPVTNHGDHALKLLTAAAKTDSIEKELNRINDESRKYDFHAHYGGFTIHQGGPFRKWRDYFDCTLIGQEQISGHDVVVLRYRQTTPLPETQAKISLPADMANQQAMQRGRFWLDLRTFQLWREEKEWTARHPAVAEPLVLVHQEMTYAPSSFGILVPQRFVFDSFHIRLQKTGPPVLTLSGRTTYTYGAFKRFDVTGEESDKKTVPVIK